MNELVKPEELILKSIYRIRNQKVMMDRDLAALYSVETKALKRAVRNGEKINQASWLLLLSLFFTLKTVIIST